MDGDEARARRIMAHDIVLNSLRYAIEERACYILSSSANEDETRQIIGLTNIATNLERVGDFAATIAHFAILRSHDTVTRVDVPILIPQMAEVAREMLEGSVEAYLSDNDLLAERVVRRDQELDSLSEQLYSQLAEVMVKLPSQQEAALQLLSVAHHLARIGDRAMNICERTIYLVTGELKEFH
jgi:phosphate transport system protein